MSNFGENRETNYLHKFTCKCRICQDIMKPQLEEGKHIPMFETGK